MTESAAPRAILRRFAALFLLGLTGIVALLAASLPALNQVAQTAGLPIGVLFLLAMIQPAVLLAIAVALGLGLAHRVGLRSILADRVAGMHEGSLRSGLLVAVVLGAVVCLVVVGFDLATRSLLPESRVVTPSGPTMPAIPGIFGALLYGGITEELLLRWGIMSLFAWIGWRITRRGEGIVRPGVMWTAIVLSAVLFGLGHLPATATLFELTPFVVFRALVLNGLFGIAAGWLYWRYRLETAMTAHMTFHLVLTGVNVLLAAFGGEFATR